MKFWIIRLVFLQLHPNELCVFVYVDMCIKKLIAHGVYAPYKHTYLHTNIYIYVIYTYVRTLVYTYILCVSVNKN